MIFGLSLAVLIGEALVMRGQLVGAVGKGLGADLLKLAPELEPDLPPELVTLCAQLPGLGTGELQVGTQARRACGQPGPLVARGLFARRRRLLDLGALTGREASQPLAP